MLQNQLIYAVYLSSSTPAQGQTGWPKIGTSNVAIADPHGLIEIASSSWNKTVIEGNRVSIQIESLFASECVRLHSEENMQNPENRPFLQKNQGKPGIVRECSIYLSQRKLVLSTDRFH